MVKRMTVKEIDKFREKLEKTETHNRYAEEQKQNAISCLKNLCDELDYNREKSMRLKE